MPKRGYGDVDGGPFKKIRSIEPAEPVKPVEPVMAVSKKTELMNACERGDLEEVRGFLSNTGNATINSVLTTESRFKGLTALSIASSKGLFKMVELLLENGADPNATRIAFNVSDETQIYQDPYEIACKAVTLHKTIGRHTYTSHQIQLIKDYIRHLLEKNGSIQGRMAIEWYTTPSTDIGRRDNHNPPAFTKAAESEYDGDPNTRFIAYQTHRNPYNGEEIHTDQKNLYLTGKETFTTITPEEISEVERLKLRGGKKKRTYKKRPKKTKKGRSRRR